MYYKAIETSAEAKASYNANQRKNCTERMKAVLKKAAALRRARKSQ